MTEVAEKPAETKPRLFPLPQLNEGELYVGAIVHPDGVTAHHLILLPGDADEINWKAANEWAASISGTLPDRLEQSLLYKFLRDQFKEDWYWSGEQNAAHSGYAWYQHFASGNQLITRKSNELRARAVRRLPI